MAASLTRWCPTLLPDIINKSHAQPLIGCITFLEAPKNHYYNIALSRWAVRIYNQETELFYFLSADRLLCFNVNSPTTFNIEPYDIVWYVDEYGRQYFRLEKATDILVYPTTVVVEPCKVKPVIIWSRLVYGNESPIESGILELLEAYTTTWIRRKIAEKFRTKKHGDIVLPEDNNWQSCGVYALISSLSRLVGGFNIFAINLLSDSIVIDKNTLGTYYTTTFSPFAFSRWPIKIVENFFLVRGFVKEQSEPTYQIVPELPCAYINLWLPGNPIYQDKVEELQNRQWMEGDPLVNLLSYLVDPSYHPFALNLDNYFVRAIPPKKVFRVILNEIVKKAYVSPHTLIYLLLALKLLEPSVVLRALYTDNQKVITKPSPITIVSEYELLRSLEPGEVLKRTVQETLDITNPIVSLIALKTEMAKTRLYFWIKPFIYVYINSAFSLYSARLINKILTEILATRPIIELKPYTRALISDILDYYKKAVNQLKSESVQLQLYGVGALKLTLVSSQFSKIYKPTVMQEVAEYITKRLFLGIPRIKKTITDSYSANTRPSLTLNVLGNVLSYGFIKSILLYKYISDKTTTLNKLSPISLVSDSILFRLYFSIQPIKSYINDIYLVLIATIATKLIQEIFQSRLLFPNSVEKLLLADTFRVATLTRTLTRLIEERYSLKQYLLGEFMVPPLQQENIFDRALQVIEIKRNRIADSFSPIFFQ